MPYLGTPPASELANLDINGQSLILDADADTHITADTDDQIDIHISGADDFQFTANTFTVSTGSRLFAPDGTGAAPSIALGASRNSGMYTTGDGNIALTASGGLSGSGHEMRFLGNGTLHIDESANGSMTTGLTINQSAADNEIFTLKSSDVAHGYTAGGSETDTYAAFQKLTGAGGGLNIMVFGDNTTATFRYTAFQAGDNATSPATSVSGAHDWKIYKHNGSGGLASPSANEIMYTWQAYTGSADRTIMVLDEDGDLHLDGSSNNTAFDSEDDALLCRSLDIMRSPNGIIKSEFDKWTKDHKASLEDAGIISKIDPNNPYHRDEDGNIGEPLLNISQLQRLHNGAIWQQRAMFETMKQIADEMIPGFAEKLNKKLAEQRLPALPISA